MSDERKNKVRPHRGLQGQHLQFRDHAHLSVVDVLFRRAGKDGSGYPAKRKILYGERQKEKKRQDSFERIFGNRNGERHDAGRGTARKNDNQNRSR